ncbi:MAG: M28 family peptidase [Planctomycetaceae bacterium]
MLKPGRTSTALLIIFLSCAVIECCVMALYRGSLPGEPSLDETQFSATRALELHRTLFQDEPRPRGTAAHRQAYQNIVTWLKSGGWSVEESPEDAEYRNIVAFRPELADRKATPLVLASHYDSCRWGPGAGDAGACVVAILEAARLMTSKPEELVRPVWLVITDAEEEGLNGAQEFVRHHALSSARPVVLNFDARGNAGPVVMFETQAGNHPVIERLANHMARPRLTGSLFTAVYRMLPNGTDFTIFRNAEWQGCNFALIDGAHHYHQPTDTIENLDARSVQHLGEMALSAGNAVARDPMDFRSDDEVPQDAIFFDVLGLHVFHMPISWSLPLRFVILFTAVQLYGRRLIRSRQFGSTFRVWAVMAVMLPLALASGWLVQKSIAGTSLLPRPFVPWGHWISLGIWAASLLQCIAIAGIGLRGIGSQCLWDAFWLAHAATCMVVSTVAPEFSYLLSVPALMAIAATVVVRDLWWRTIVVSCATAIILVPLDHLIAIALGPWNAMLLFPAFALLIMPMLPAFADFSDSLVAVTPVASGAAQQKETGSQGQ